ncbi:SAV_6107 family HEPN domain-containing protein [Streptomyces gibsoniae]|uniref:SAV_6107 family HEPN domain-containing protein n=1 Tax=Streptomyces gibsoniae TaxID=3075529 RepID=A0ABU2TL44_9ACTN|nr:SAV_6107 family HEPN domain-containing protein [Streptomyces sp. DSM 41699]MDT0461653.1 SAV_6107 family HEPN domain-containing protein [Streptomyces sp. DSM 41699]
MASYPAGAAPRRRATGPAPSLTGPASDVHPVLRRATAPPAALDLLAQARAGLDEAVRLETPNERYATAHLAALRTAAAVLAARGRPEPTARRRARIRSAWEVLPEIAPELTEWSALFASGAARRARAEAGIPGAARPRDADDLIRDVAMFLRLVERMLVLQPVLPQSRQIGERETAERGGGARGPGERGSGDWGDRGMGERGMEDREMPDAG